MVKKILLLFFINAFCIVKAQTTHTVTSASSFNTALNNANSGDIIEWQDGTYSNVYMDIDVNGVTVKAQTSGGVIFNGSSRVDIDADDVNFMGFQYIGGNIGTSHVARIFGSRVLFENINIDEYTSYKYLIVDEESQYATIKNCNFEHRVNDPDQNILSILINENQPGFHKIQFCSFKNFDGEPQNGSLGDAGVEPIRIGDSKTDQHNSKSIVEYSYFTQCNGDGEIISHKGTECIYRYNTFENNPEGELVLRHGDKGIVYGNFFLNNKGGVRIQEATDHVIFNNYFSGLTSRSLNLNASSAAKLDNILIAYNTFVDTDVIDIENHSTDEATNVTLANNIFANPSSNDGLFEDLTGNETWIGNIAFGDLGEASSSDFTIQNPGLSLNSEGFYSISADSPVVNSGVAGYPALPVFTDLAYDNEILLDVLKQARPVSDSMKDVGCQEYTANTVLKAHVTEANTGPDYLMDPNTLSISNELLVNNNFNVYPNPLIDDTIKINFSVDEQSDVKVDVYDLSGKKLFNLIDDSFDFGNHSFNSKLNLGSGVYLLSIQVSARGKVVNTVKKILK